MERISRQTGTDLGGRGRALRFCLRLVALAFLPGILSAGEAPDAPARAPVAVTGEHALLTLRDGSTLEGVLVFSGPRGTVLALDDGETPERFVPAESIRSVRSAPAAGATAARREYGLRAEAGSLVLAPASHRGASGSAAATGRGEAEDGAYLPGMDFLEGMFLDDEVDLAGDDRAADPARAGGGRSGEGGGSGESSAQSSSDDRQGMQALFVPGRVLIVPSNTLGGARIQAGRDEDAPSKESRTPSGGGLFGPGNDFDDDDSDDERRERLRDAADEFEGLF